MGAFTALLPSLISGGAGLLGSIFGGNEEEEGVQAAMEAARILGVRGPFGSAGQVGGELRSQLSRPFQRQLRDLNKLSARELRQLRKLNIPGLEEKELKRLRQLADPEEQRLRAKVRNEAFRRGRLGLGVASGRTEGAFVNPEIAAVEEALATADLMRQGAAQSFARSEQERLIGNVGAFSGLGQQLAYGPINAAQIGIQGRMPQGIAGLPAIAGSNRADVIASIFAGLGSGFGSVFGQPGGLSF